MNCTFSYCLILIFAFRTYKFNGIRPCYVSVLDIMRRWIIGRHKLLGIKYKNYFKNLYFCVYISPTVTEFVLRNLCKSEGNSYLKF